MKVVKETHRLKPLFRFLNRLKRNAPRNLQSIALKAGDNVWNEIDCLSCANCCKTMTPTYTNTDITPTHIWAKILRGKNWETVEKDIILEEKKR